MTHRRDPDRRRALGLAVVASVLGVAASIWGVATLVSRGTAGDAAAGEPGIAVSSPGSAIPAPTVAAKARPAKAARRVGAVVPEAPRRAVLPSGVEVPVRAVSSRPDGLLDVPDDIRIAGWWRGGSRIGDPFGSTLIAAHVDSSTQGLGRFAELLSVRPGAKIVVSTQHLTQTFRVRSLQLVPQGTLTDDAWIYGIKGQRRLTLVTCAGPYEADNGGYQNLAVVTAVPVDAPARLRSGR